MKSSHLRIGLFIAACFTFQTSFSQDTVFVAAPNEADTMIFEKVEIEPTVDKQAWIAHLKKELLPIIERAAGIKGIKPGSYVVNVRFLVEKDGSISDVKALKDPGYGFGNGACDVVRSGPKWTPGKHKGKPIRTYHTQPIYFILSE